MRKIEKLTDVVDWRLCVGCGACAAVCPQEKIALWDFKEEGIRPVVSAGDCGSCRACVEVCPGIRSEFDLPAETGTPDADFAKEWGPVLEIWEGHASDPEIRYKGSSGGALTAIGLYCVEVLGMHGVLHIGQDPEDPLRNRTRLSRTRDQLLKTAGSRYSPASVANGLGLVEAAPAPCVVIGKPSEISAVRNARAMRPGLDARVGVTLSFFCAETPATGGLVKLLNKLGVEEMELSKLKFRGGGWPGNFEPVKKGHTEAHAKMTYQDSWAFLQAHRPWSVQLWPDGNGEQADISCGDPWYEKPDGKNPGFSLVVVRTERGREIVEGAMKAGYLTLTRAENWKLAKSQPGLLAKKGAVHGRRMAMKLLGLPVTRLEGLDLAHCFQLLSWKEKLKATAGTVRRIMGRKLYRPLKLDPSGAVPVAAPWEEAGPDKPMAAVPYEAGSPL